MELPARHRPWRACSRATGFSPSSMLEPTGCGGVPGGRPPRSGRPRKAFTDRAGAPEITLINMIFIAKIHWSRGPRDGPKIYLFDLERDGDGEEGRSKMASMTVSSLAMPRARAAPKRAVLKSRSTTRMAAAAGEVPDMNKRNVLNLMLLGAVGLPGTATLGGYAWFCRGPPRSAGTRGSSCPSPRAAGAAGSRPRTPRATTSWRVGAGPRGQPCAYPVGRRFCAAGETYDAPLMQRSAEKARQGQRRRPLRSRPHHAGVVSPAFGAVRGEPPRRIQCAQCDGVRWGG